MASPTQALYLLFLGTHLYMNLIHFPIPSTGFASSTSPILLITFTLLTILLSFPPVLLHAPQAPETIESSIFGKVAFLTLLSSIILYIWTAASTTGAKTELAAVFSRAAPKKVVKGGPYAYIRHPAYAASILGFIGVLGAAMGAVKPEAMERAYRGEGGGDIGPRVLGLIAITCVLGSLFFSAARAEEAAFLRGKGERVDERVKAEYARYAREVPARFVPGLF